MKKIRLDSKGFCGDPTSRQNSHAFYFIATLVYFLVFIYYLKTKTCK